MSAGAGKGTEITESSRELPAAFLDSIIALHF